MSSALLKNARRIVIKIGSSLIADTAQFALRNEWLCAIAEDLAALRKSGKEIILVSSGAVTLGRGVLARAGSSALPSATTKMSEFPLEMKQALAACGQIALVDAWRDALAPHGLTAAQMLLTLSDMEHRRPYLNARSCLNQLLALGTIPVINENDTTATAEIRVGDNDRLAARVAELASADLLILLSDVDGLYTADPSQDPKAKHIAEIATLTPEIEAMAAPAQTAVGSGGMRTKLMAARIAVQAGCHMAITNGRGLHPLKALSDGARASWFSSQSNPLSSRKRWIAGTLQPKGRVKIDVGAEAALKKGNSLLAVGITHMEGKFDRGDCLAVLNAEGRELARGLAGYDHDDARKILGKRSEDLEAILGSQPRSAFIHRDDLVLL